MTRNLLVLIIILLSPVLLSAQKDTAGSDGSEGRASYYAKSFQGLKTANGELFDNYDYTAAH